MSFTFRVPWKPHKSRKAHRKARVAYYKAREDGTLSGLVIRPEPMSLCVDITAESIADLKRLIPRRIMPDDPRPVMLASDRVLRSFRIA